MTHQSHRLAVLIGLLVAFSTVFGSAAVAQDAEERRGLRSNNPEASPAFFPTHVGRCISILGLTRIAPRLREGLEKGLLLRFLFVSHELFD